LHVNVHKYLHLFHPQPNLTFFYCRVEQFDLDELFSYSVILYHYICVTALHAHFHGIH